MSRLWRYHGPGRYSWSHDEGDENVIPRSSDKEVSGDDLDVGELLSDAIDVVDTCGDPAPGLEAGNAPSDECSVCV